MKKFFQSKGFIVSSLALLCVSILGVCWFVSRDRTGDFRPDESPPSSVTGDWSDGGTQTDGDNGADAYAPGQSTDAKEEYPKVTSQTEDELLAEQDKTLQEIYFPETLIEEEAADAENSDVESEPQETETAESAQSTNETAPSAE